MNFLDKVTTKIKIVKTKLLPTDVSSRTSTRRQEFNLDEISQIASIEGYFNRSIRKKEINVFKEGYYIDSIRKQAAQYINDKMYEMEYASGISFNEILKQIVHELILFQNVFIKKIRNKASTSTGTTKDRFGKNTVPVAALQILPTSRVLPVIKEGMLDSYSLVDNGNKELEKIKKEDMIHIHTPRVTGSFLAMPDVIPIIEDILSLRRIEENVETMVYRHAVPFMVMYIGSDEKPVTIVNVDTGETEIDYGARLIEDAQPGQALILPHRYKVDIVGSKNTAMDLTKYLEHFKKRIFAGLGMSAYDFGESDSANRSSGQTLSKSFIETCKDIQTTVSDGFAQFFMEILLEKYAPEQVYSDKNKVLLQWHEIDPERITRDENSTVQLFVTDLIDRKEARTRIKITTDPDESLMFSKLTGGDTNINSDSAKGKTKNEVTPTNQHSNSINKKHKEIESIKDISYSQLLNDTERIEITRFLQKHYNLKQEVVDMITRQIILIAKQKTPIIRDVIVRVMFRNVLEQGEATN